MGIIFSSYPTHKKRILFFLEKPGKSGHDKKRRYYSVLQLHINVHFINNKKSSTCYSEKNVSSFNVIVYTS